METVEPSWVQIDDETVNNPLHRTAPVERIVDALLEADEQRFYEFHPTADAWRTPEAHCRPHSPPASRSGALPEAWA